MDPIGFLRGLWGQPPWVRVWVGWLVLVHGVMPLAFLGRTGGKLMLGGFVVGVVLMALLHARFGFTRILGLAHLAWIPGLVVIARDVWAFPYGGFAWWAGLALPTGALCLGIDTVDVVRWVRGDRAPTTTA